MENKRYYTYTLNTLILNIMAIFILFSLVIINNCFFNLHIFNFNTHTFIIMILWLILHEVIHAIGFFVSRNVKWSNIVFGMFLEQGIFYCMCKQEINKKNILFSLMLPLIIIGVLTLIVGYILSNPLLVLLSIINISGCAGDIMMGFLMLKLPKDIKYLDLDDPTSFTIVSNSDLSDIKVLGIQLKQEGIYNKNKIFSKNKKKIEISKLSYLFLIFLFILLVIGVLT